MVFTLDWSLSNLDAANTLVSGVDTVIATVSTPTGPGEFQVLANAPGDMPNGVLSSNLVFQPQSAAPLVTVNFDVEVSNIAFTLYDVDQANTGGYTWDDLVGIQALDAFGNPVAVTYTVADGQVISGPDANGFYYVEGQVTDPLELGSVTVSIAGPVASLTINFVNGPDNLDAGYIGVGDLTFDLYQAPCFVRGTLIETQRGDVAVQDLLVDDMVRTLDNALQPIRWIGSAKVSAKGSLAPILFKAGAVGNTSDLYVSPWHRMMLQGWQVELLFGGNEMLASAKSLVNDNTILRVESDEVEYFHILFDQHQIVFSNGAPTESFHPGDLAINALAQKSRAEILELFPELGQNNASYGPSVRATLSGSEATLLSI